MRRKTGIVAVAVLLITGTVFPAPAPAPAPGGKEAAAAELLSVIGLERQMVSAATAMIDAQLQQNPQLAPYRDVMVKWAGTYLTWESMGPRITAIYAEKFSEAELKELTAFYKTPTGQKALAQMPDLMQKGAAIGAEIAKQHTPELEQMIQQRSEELGKAAKPESGGS